MKYISELDVLAIIESLERKLEVNPSNPINNALYGQAGAIYSFRQELDQLIVSKLRPMSEAPIREDILTKIKDTDRLIESFCDDGLCYIHNNYFILDQCEGWIPMPQYKPEE